VEHKGSHPSSAASFLVIVVPVRLVLWCRYRPVYSAEVPVSQKLATGQILVKAGGYVQYRITIAAEMVEPVITGSFNASGGTGNDINAVIADEMNYTNWINGHQARVFLGTEGKQTTGNFEVRLRPGRYYLVFSNMFSAFTDKQVFLEVDLNHKRAETYY
jgi:hypothetical protein